MATIYLDHNVIADIAGVPGRHDAQAMHGQALTLKKAGHRFVLSAWNVYELARSNNQQHVDQCGEFVETLDPLWASDIGWVRWQEVERFLQPHFDNVGPVRNRNFRPFNTTVRQMWESFGDGGPQEQTFRSSVALLRARDAFIEGVHAAAKETIAAISELRAPYKAGLGELLEDPGDPEYLRRILRERPSELDFLVMMWYQSGVTVEYLSQHFPLLAVAQCLRDVQWAWKRGAVEREGVVRDYGSLTSARQWDFLAKNKVLLLAACPAIAVERALTAVRLGDSFKPTPSHAPDLQHAVFALAYCDYFVSADRQLMGHCEYVVAKLRLVCKVCKSLLDIVA